MTRRHRLEPLSPRAMARLQAPRTGYVPTAHELGPAGPSTSMGGHGLSEVDRATRLASRADVEAVEEDGGLLLDWVPTVPEDDLEWDAGDSRRSRMRAWFRLPESFVGARWEPGRLAVIGLAVVVAVAVALFGLRVAWAAGDGTVLAPGGGSRAGPTGLSAGAAPVGAGSASGFPSPSPSTPSPTAPTKVWAAGVVVHVVGKVRKPGLQRLPAGSRVADAVEAAGGAATGADLARVNLARMLVDGEQVVVPAPGDPDPPGAPTAGGGTGGSGGGSAAGGSGTGSGGGGLVSINTADLSVLDTLPGVGPVLAQRILDWRTEHGRFTTVDELGEVSGIGEKMMERLRPLVTL